MRNTSIQFLLDTLYHRIKINNVFVPIVKQSQIRDKTPCITLDNQNTNLQATYYTYDPLEHFNRRFDATTVVNIWCNSETERQKILDQVDDCFNAILNEYYQYCTKYEDGYCTSLETDCKTLESLSSRAYKNQCPRPLEYGYENLFTKYHVNPNTFGVDQGVDNDEYDKKDVLLRTMITVTLEYVIVYDVGGKISEKLIYEGE